MEEQQHSGSSRDYKKKVNLQTTKIDFGYMEGKGVSALEYCFLEMVSCLSVSNSAYGFRCNATYEYLALQLGISIITAKRMAKSLMERGLLIVYNYGNAKLTRCSENWQPPRKSYDYTIVDHEAARTIGIEVDEMLCLDTIFQGSRLLKRDAYTFGIDFLVERMDISRRKVFMILDKMKDLGFIKLQSKKIYIENKWTKERFGNNFPNIPAVIYAKKRTKKIDLSRQNDTLKTQKNNDLKCKNDTVNSAKMIRSGEVYSANLIRNSNIFYNKRNDSNSNAFEENPTSCLVGGNASCLVGESSTEGIDQKKRQSPPIAPPPPLEKICIKKDVMQVEKEEFSSMIRGIINKKIRGSEVDQDVREEIISSFIDFLVSINFEVRVEPKSKDYPQKAKDYGYQRDRASYLRSVAAVVSMFEKSVANRLRMNGGTFERQPKSVSSKEDPLFQEFMNNMAYFYECSVTRSFLEGFHAGEVDFTKRIPELRSMLELNFKNLNGVKKGDATLVGLAFVTQHRTTDRMGLKDFLFKLRYKYEETLLVGGKIFRSLNQEGPILQRIKQNL